MAPHWKGPYTVVLTTPLVVKVAGVTPWINHMSMKRQTQKTLSGLCRGTPLTLGRLRSSLRRKRKRRSRTSPFRMKPHNQLLLFGLINVILNLTSISTQDNVFISWAHSYADFHNTSNCWVCRAMPLSVMDGLPWWVSPLCQGDFKPLCSFLGWQKRLSSLLSIITSPCSLGVRPTVNRLRSWGYIWYKCQCNKSLTYNKPQ